MVETLEKLNFSFWQPIFIVVLLLFRAEVKALLSRLNQIKAGSTEWGFSRKDEAQLEILENIKSKTSSDDQTVQSIQEHVENLIDKKALDAILSIKIHTRFLWEELTKNRTLKSVINAEILENTISRIDKDLHLLKRLNHINYELVFEYRLEKENLDVYSIRVEIASGEFSRLISEVEMTQF